MPDSAIPHRKLGRTDIRVSALTLGGHHLGNTAGVPVSLQIVREAFEGGITTYDNCWEYHLGATELMVGQALKGKRDQVVLMTKVCTHGRDKDLATVSYTHLDVYKRQALYRSADLLGVGYLANIVRERKSGNVTYFNVNRHINPTDVCVASCRLCAFGKKAKDPKAYTMSLDQVWHLSLIHI